MKPSEMSNEELADWLCRFAGKDEGTNCEADRVAAKMHEAAARLRNSIPKPVVKNAYEEGWYDGAIAVSGERMTALHDVLFAEYWAGSEARTALGINDTKGRV